jgi:nicotinamidase-related amidase
MGQLFAPPGPKAVHLCIDMQRLFEPGAPWATPWMERVTPQVAALAQRTPTRTVFTRFIPPQNKEAARGVWKIYYEKWENVTRSHLNPAMLELTPPLARYAPPAAIIDRQTYSAFTDGRLQSYLDRHGTDTLIVSGGETDVCVLASVLSAIDIGYRVIIAEDALCSSSDESHDALLGLYTKRFSLQIEVTSSEDILACWHPND